MWAASIKSREDHQQLVKYKSTTIKTSRPALTVTSSKDRPIEAYSISQTIPEKLRCLNKKKEKKKDEESVAQNAINAKRH